MLVTRRRVVEEEVTAVINNNSGDDSRKKWMKFEKNRLDSFPLWSLNHHRLDVSDAYRFIRAGFYCYAFGTECFLCGLRKHRSFWLEGHDPEAVHRTERPNCEFVKGQSDNVSIDAEQWWSDVGLAQRLATTGFYQTISGGTECFSCGLWKPSFFWWEGHDPETVHREENPNCLFVLGESDNVPIDPQLRKIHSFTETEILRQHGEPKLLEGTDTKLTKINEQETGETSLASERSTAPRKVSPNSVKVTVTRSTSLDLTSDPKGHSVVESTCNSSVITRCSSDVSREELFGSSVTQDYFMQGNFASLAVTDETHCPTVAYSAIPPDIPKHPEFALESERLSTFRTWAVQSPEILCKAGFYYTGEKDAVRCFYCDGSLCNWERTHDPFTEHARWYPNCAFIKSVKMGKRTGLDQQCTSIVVPSAVQPTIPFNAGEILQSLIQDNQERWRKAEEARKKLLEVEQQAKETRKMLEENEEHAQETGKKLQVLMDVVDYKQPSSPLPVCPATTSSSQQTISAQRQLQWHQYDSSASRLSRVSRSDHVMYGQEMTMAPPAVETIQRADQTEMEHHKILMKIAAAITLPDELSMLGIWLGCEPNDVRRLKNRNPSLKDAAYEVLCSFYYSVPNEQRWRNLTEALKELNKHALVTELRLEELHSKAQICT